MTKRTVFALLGAVMSLMLWIGSAKAQDNTTTTTDPNTTTSEHTVTEKVTTIRETETHVVEQQHHEGIRTVAIFIKNRASNVDDAKVSVLEDFITSRLTDKGFRVISREDSLNAVSAFANAGPNKGDPNLGGANLDALLSNNTSALRLAQNLNADYLLVASITTYGNDTTEYQGDGIHTIINEGHMTVSCKLEDTAAGGSVTGDVIEVSKKDRAEPGVKIKRDMVNELLDEASVKLADRLGDKAASGAIRGAPKASDEMVSFNAVCSMGDLTVPEIDKTADGQYVVGANRYTVQAMNVTVAVDGVTIGTTPGPFQAMPGLHKISFTRDGFKNWDQTINIRSGMTLNVAMQMTDAGFDRWKETAAFMQGLKENDKLTDAQVKEMEGHAKMLSQSDFHYTTQNIFLPNTDHPVQQNTQTNITVQQH